jgi:ABC-type Na+ efflux pump permease subunit
MVDATATAHALRSRHSRWVYVIPILHLCVCLLALVGFVIPALQPLAIAFEFLWVADLPFSIVGFILAWQHPTLAMIWMVSVGTLWWYALSCGVEILWKRFKDRGRASLKL